jgi:hypothetical protein
MFHVHSPRVPATIAAVAALAAVAAGCSNSPAATHTTGASKATTVQTGPVYTAAQLRDALLTTLDGVKPAVPVESGLYGDLPGVKATRASLNGVKITPAKCATASSTGLASPKFNQVPATVTTFRDGSDGVSEVLLSPPAALMNSALTHAIPAGCAEYHAKVGSHTYTYRVRQAAAPALGNETSELNVRAFGSDSANIWTVIYRTSGMVGAVTLVGAKASKADADTLAEMAYQHAEKMLG